MQFASPPALRLGGFPKPAGDSMASRRGENTEDFKSQRFSPQREEAKKEASAVPAAAAPVEQPKAAYGGLSDPFKISMQDQRIKDCFPWADKVWHSCVMTCCGCLGQRYNSTAEMLQGIGKPGQTFPREKYEDKIMKLAVNCTGLLELDDKTVHPFVRAHIVDIRTGKYLAKRNPSQPAVTNRESAAVIQYAGASSATREIDSDFVPPFATRYCDFRITGENRADYYESFMVNEPLENIYNENTVILFEILDYNVGLILNDDPALRQNLYPVAWAYLRPLGEALIHSSTKRLQLYRYKMVPTSGLMKQDFIDPRTPMVYYDFNWPVHVRSRCIRTRIRPSTRHSLRWRSRS